MPSEAERQIKQLAEEFRKHFLSTACPCCPAQIGEPCHLEGGRFHIDRGCMVVPESEKVQ